MRCKNCPAYWEDVTPMVGVEDWGCYCEPDKGSDQGRELKNGDYGCNRKRAYIDKVMTRVKESEKRSLMLEEAAYEKAMLEQMEREQMEREQMEREQMEFELQCGNYDFKHGDVKY